MFSVAQVARQLAAHSSEAGSFPPSASPVIPSPKCGIFPQFSVPMVVSPLLQPSVPAPLANEPDRDAASSKAPAAAVPQSLEQEAGG